MHSKEVAEKLFSTPNLQNKLNNDHYTNQNKLNFSNDDIEMITTIDSYDDVNYFEKFGYI